jgi:hypothetical protein
MLRPLFNGFLVSQLSFSFPLRPESLGFWFSLTSLMEVVVDADFLQM